ncbi:hypothetical protein N825_12340 [Skermanella stibiiresistens SB22]|uniref:DUF6285 domain-containing protein n=1 Tax=Skermanella stibiiresistens SB22 TaxID=1385369 RepID=W9H4B0_9PROT|nr:DUF6285 domain-containing protein [Skermanella stibiiresistens]EWY38593.1 hypothetical protein N825_12340 [Skermanella stibiiresistens SB22]
MRDQPTAANLLDTALKIYRERLLPLLPAEHRYEALMVANAIAISARQVEAGDAPLEEARRRLAAIYPDDDGSLSDLETRLSSEIRQGAFDQDGPNRDAAFDYLWWRTRAKAAESNPRASQLRG